MNLNTLQRQALTVNLMGSTTITWEVGILPCGKITFILFLRLEDLPTGHHSLGWDPGLHTREGAEQQQASTGSLLLVMNVLQLPDRMDWAPEL